MKFIKYLKFALTIIILCGLQVSLADLVEINGISPNIVISFVISTGIICGVGYGISVGLICGIIIDALSSGTTVVSAIIYMIIGALGAYLVKGYMRKNAGVIALFTFIASFLFEEIVHFLHFTIWSSSGVLEGILYPSVPTAIYSAIISVPIFFLTNALFGEKKQGGLHR